MDRRDQHTAYCGYFTGIYAVSRDKDKELPWRMVSVGKGAVAKVECNNSIGQINKNRFHRGKKKFD
jgi:hypothetical protein